MLSKKHVSSQMKKWGFASCHADVNERLNRAVANFVKRLASQKGGRVVLPSEWFGIDSGRYAADANQGSLGVTEHWIRPPMQASDPTGSIVGGRKQGGGRIVQSSEWFGVDSGRYSADANQGSSLDVTADWIRPPLQASDPTGSIVGGGRKFVVTQKAINEACSGMGIGKQQKMAAKSALESTLTELFDGIAKKNKNQNHLSLAAFEEVFRQRKYNKLR